MVEVAEEAMDDHRATAPIVAPTFQHHLAMPSHRDLGSRFGHTLGPILESKGRSLSHS